MLAIGMVLVSLGYSAVYVGVYRLLGDKRNVRDIFMGSTGTASATNSSNGSNSSSGKSSPLTNSQLETQQQLQKEANSPHLTVGPNQGAGPLKPGTTTQIPNPDYKPPLLGGS